MKKILFVINTMGRAGAESALNNLLKRLSGMPEYSLSLYVMIPRGELFAGVPEGVRILNRRVSRGSVLSASGRLFIARQALCAFFRRGAGFRMLPSIVKNLLRQKKDTGRIQLDKAMWRLFSESVPAPKEDFDLAVAYLEGSATYFVADRVRARRKAAFIHIDYGRAGYTPEMDEGCYDRIDRIFTVSGEVADRFLDVYPGCRDKVYLFRNLLDREDILRKAQEKAFEARPAGTLLVTVGRLHYQKAYDIAIAVCSRLKADGYPVNWYVLGDGSERTGLERLIDECQVRDSFHLMGAVENPYPFIAAADIYVHVTRFEGKSIAIEEAQILGRPILASDCTGNREQIADGYDGILCELTVDSVTRALEDMIDRPELRNMLHENVLQKRMEHPEDMEALLSLAGSAARAAE
ncbi:MAG: glycosyltransferase [Bacillota bacterium]|nr:glycosyltransferase [Bacillota bacterium]